MTYHVGHLVGGKTVEGKSGRTADVFDPNTGEVQGKVALASTAEVNEAIENAAVAQRAWAATNPQVRARVLFKFLQLAERDKDNLARLLSSEHGKTIPDAHGDIQRGLEVVEFACGIPHLQKGEFTEGAGPNIDMYSMRPAFGCCRRHYPVQLPSNDPNVEVCAGNRLRQCLHHEAFRTGPLCPHAPGGTDAGSRPARRCLECGQWRQGSR